MTRYRLWFTALPKSLVHWKSNIVAKYVFLFYNKSWFFCCHGELRKNLLKLYSLFEHKQNYVIDFNVKILQSKKQEVYCGYKYDC